MCSPRTAKTLKKIGVPQDSYFSWCKPQDSWELQVTAGIPGGTEHFAAFMASEISDLYPKHVWLSIGDNGAKRREAIFYFAKIMDTYKSTLMVANSKTGELVEIQREEDDNEAESRSRLYIYLEKEANIANHV